MYKVGFTNIFGSEDHLKQIVKSLGGIYKKTEEKTGFGGCDAPDTVSLISISPKKVREIMRKNNSKLCIENFYEI